MRVKDVTISKGMTVNLGNHSFHKVEVGMTATLDDDETFVEDLENLTELVNAKLAQEVEKVLPKRQTLMETKLSKERWTAGIDETAV
jgi:hypothetical protein